MMVMGNSMPICNRLENQSVADGTPSKHGAEEIRKVFQPNKGGTKQAQLWFEILKGHQQAAHGDVVEQDVERQRRQNHNTVKASSSPCSFWMLYQLYFRPFRTWLTELAEADADLLITHFIPLLP